MSLSEQRKELTEKIIAKLEVGVIPWRREWTGVDNTPYNPTTSKAYKGINSIKLSMVGMENGYGDPRWVTFNQAKKEGWSVKAGSKSTGIEYWKIHEEKEVKDENGNITKETVELKQPKVFFARVFNASQIDGMPPLEKKEYSQQWQVETEAEKILSNSGAKIQHVRGGEAFYRYNEDKIFLPLKEQFSEAKSYYATALHELGHWTGHSSRLNREMFSSFGTKDYAKEELRAELASYFISNKLGLPSSLDNHASYIDYWVKILKENQNEIYKAASEAEKISDFILEFQKQKERTMEETTTQQEVEKTEPTTNIAKADVRLMGSYSDKDTLRQLGAEFDKESKTWYAPKGADLSNFKDFMGEKICSLKDLPINVSFDDKDKARAAGAWWDKDNKTWFMPAGSDIKNLPDSFFQERVNEANHDTSKLSFEDFARAKGLLIDGQAIADGKLQRVAVDGGKPNAKDGAYVLFSDDNGRAGWFKNFKSGFEANYGEGSKTGEIKQISAEEKESRRQFEAAKHANAAKTADYLIKEKFLPAEKHPYLEAKGIKAHGAMVDKEGSLIIPLKNMEGEVRTFQKILDDGRKGYMKGGEVQGSVYSFGSPKDSVIICEGFATGASLFESTKIPTVCAMQTTNLETVAKDIREKYGDKMQIVLAADNDHKTQENPGVKHAELAAKAVGGTVIIPQLTEDEKSKGLTDFNDIMLSRGKDAVKQQVFEQAKELPQPSKLKSKDRGAEM